MKNRLKRLVKKNHKLITKLKIFIHAKSIMNNGSKNTNKKIDTLKLFTFNDSFVHSTQQLVL